MKQKSKYYLRGLGLGIVVTAVIMSIAASKDRKMTNEEIISRAKQLGMIESTVLTEGTDRESDVENEADDKQSVDTESGAAGSGDIASLSKVSAAELDNHTEGEVSEPDTRTDGEVSESDIRTDSGISESDAQEDGSVSEPDVQTNDGESESDIQTGSDETVSEFPKVVVISSGEGSYTVSKRLATIGAIESAEDFDTYLCEHGYDKKIRAGTYTIPVGATDEQMAKIITGAKVTE